MRNRITPLMALYFPDGNNMTRPATDLPSNFVVYGHRARALAQELEFHAVTDVTSKDFKSLFEIYCEALPASEKKTLEQLSYDIQRPGYYFFVAKVRDQVLGFSIYYTSQTREFVLLEYMAIRCDLRNKGIGTRLFWQLIDFVRGNYGPIPILLEVESDREDSADRAIRTRRLSFYIRQGCLRVQGFNYILPLETKEFPPMMDILIYSDKNDIPKDRFVSFLRAIYCEVYGASRNDRRIDFTAASLSDPVSLE
jgi:ribosomal protein S18 acetylase RimI-like enzyme